MAYIDRRTTPTAFLETSGVALTAMISHALTCPDCEVFSDEDLDKGLVTAPIDGAISFRAHEELWTAYSAIVGDGGRSADLKAYIEWRVDNPTTPLPGRRRGPVKKIRKTAREALAAGEGKPETRASKAMSAKPSAE